LLRLPEEGSPRRRIERWRVRQGVNNARSPSFEICGYLP
jgi:hypothetical protein